MSRNKEKAQAGLNRYYDQKVHDAGVVTADPSKRPKRVQTVTTIAEAELWRKTILGEFSAKLSSINNSSLAEDELREINDQINKIYNEKRAWEYHILSLGGNDYIRYEKRIGTRRNGKTFFGRAKELPEAIIPEKVKLNTGSSLAKNVSLSLAYYGVFDGNTNRGWQENFDFSQWDETIDSSEDKIEEEINGPSRQNTFTQIGQNTVESSRYTQKDVERWLVERRKRELLAKLMM